MGEPGAGRSDLIDALDRVLSPDFARLRVPTEFDFYNRDTSKRAEVEVTLGDLGDELEQEFLDHLEVWNREEKILVDELSDPEAIDREGYDLVVRLCYRASWVQKEETAEQWVDYPKTSDPDAGNFDRVARQQRAILPFVVIGEQNRIFDLSPRSGFRRLAESGSGDDFTQALMTLENQIDQLAVNFSRTQQVSSALENILTPLRTPLRFGRAAAAEIVRFLPEGGALSGLIRSLSPAVDAQDGVGTLPLRRHSSTLVTMLRLAQALAEVGTRGVIAIDDFGEGLDGPSAEHLASVLRRSASQIWLSTRRYHAAGIFSPNELVRLARNSSGERCVYRGRSPKTRTERLVSRHWGIQLLPAMSSRAVIVIEGPHDRAALTTLSLKLNRQEGTFLPSANGVSFIDAGAADSSGGVSGVIRLAAAAKELGFQTVAIIDCDKGGQQSQKDILEEALRSADVVVQLPKGMAIEKALLSEIEEQIIKITIKELEFAFGGALYNGLNDLKGSPLIKRVMELIKKNNLHAQFIEALPDKTYPPVAQKILEASIEAVIQKKTGLIPL